MFFLIMNSFDMWKTILLSLVIIVKLTICLELDEECGIPDLSAAGLVSGGEVAKKNQWPWFSHLRIDFGPDWSSQICGGNLISNKHILTSAHCTHFPDQPTTIAKKITVTLGKQYFDDFVRHERHVSILDTQGVSLKFDKTV